MLALALAGALLGPATGRAQPVASSVEPSAVDPPAKPPDATAEPEPAPAPVPEPTAADVDGAPVPGQEGGRIDPGDGGDSPLRLIGRGILFLPRVVVQAALAPVRAGIWANERYRLTERAYALLFNEAGTMGVYPIVSLESEFGFNVGVKFAHRDLFGARERVSLSAATGGRYRRAFEAAFGTGDRLGDRLRLGLRGEYDLRPEERFFGIGNGDEEELAIVRIDPLVDPTAVETRYRQELMRATAVADVRVARALRVIGSGAVTDLEVARSESGPPIDVVYQPDALIGWTGVRNLYAELELRWDSRRRTSPWEPRPLPSAGWLAAAYGGRVHRLDDGPGYWRYGGDLQRFVRIGQGPRVISVRAHLEGVTGERDEVPFFELPQLGGSRLLRGYATERFRDRIAALASFDYQWDLSQIFSARVFADVGRVYASLDDLGLDGLRLGYGIGLDAHSRNSFALRTSLASSIDGGVFVNLSFEPVFELYSRVERR